MAFMDYFKRNKAPIEDVETFDINEKSNYEKVAIAKPAKIDLSPKQVKSFVVKAIGQINGAFSDRERFERPEYNLWEIKEATEADSYIKIALSKYSNLIYKAGYSLKGEDKKVAYLNKRFRVMSFATQKPIDILFQEVANDLLTYSNAFLVKRRIDYIPGMDLNPVLADKVVGGYFRVDPASMKIKRDKSGNVLKYEQGYGKEKKQFFPRDVIHFYLDKDANNAFGTPRIIAALEDVKLLRKIEGNVAALIYRFSMPVYHWKVGLPTPGYEAGDTEITEAKREIEGSSLDSIVVTSERVDIKGIGAEGTAINAEGYLKYFEQRTFSALGVSDAQMGRGGSKQDADSMESQVHDMVKHIQRTMSIFIREYVLSELLLEGGFNPILNEKDIVEYEFDEISLDTKVKTENHEMLKWQSNFTTLPESRRKLGMKDMPEKEGMMYKDQIETKARLTELDRNKENQIEIINIQAKIAEKAAKQQAEFNKANEANSPKSNDKKNSKNTGGNSKPRSSKSSSPSKEVTTKNRPKNQHGETSVKIKESLSYNHNDDALSIYKSYLSDIESGNNCDVMYNIKNKLRKDLHQTACKGYKDGLKELEESYIIPEELLDNEIYYIERAYELEDAASMFIDSVFNVINENINSNILFEALHSGAMTTLSLYEEKIQKQAYWIGYLSAGEKVDNSLCAYITSEDEKESLKYENVKINTGNYTLNDIPPFFEDCSCLLTYNNKKEGEK